LSKGKFTNIIPKMIFDKMKIYRIVSSRVIKLMTVLFLFELLFFGNIGINAQSNQTLTNTNNSQILAQDAGVLGFADCMVDENKPQMGQGAQVITKCFLSISRFVFVVGIIVAGYKFAVNTLGSYIPGQSVDAVKEGREAIWGFVVGALLIGAPGAILSLFNSGALRLDFLSGLSSLGQANRTGTSSTTNNTSGNSGTGNNTNNGTNNNGTGNNGTNSSDNNTNDNNSSASTNPQARNLYTITSIKQTVPAQFPLTATSPDDCQYITFEATPSSSANTTLTRLIAGRFCASTNSPYYYKRLGSNLNIRLDTVNAINQTFTFVIPTGQTINITSLDQV
jgi:hypothetical protein